MSNEPTRPVQDEGEAGLSHLDRRDHIPNQLEIDFGDDHADRWPIADNRNRQVRFGAAMVAYVAEPDLVERAPITAGSADRSVRLSIRLRPIRET